MEPNGDPLALLAKFENFSVTPGELGKPIRNQLVLLDSLDRLTPEYEQEVRHLHTKGTLTAAKVCMYI